ncbi:MAG: DUF4332 domain-containing protein [Armatimonadetes bacterium]|nr:DUF4332 domain-containing protein [Armatimonadota bacterium]
MANIEDIEGVGPAYAEKLAAAGVKSVEKLLEVGGTKKGRQSLAESSGVDESKILKWVNHADLMRLNGVGPQFAELLEAAGVDTVKELRGRRADNLAAKMAEVNEAKNLANRTPNEDMISGWIEEAKTLSEAVSH